ncbi:MAG: flavin-containing monooxygenase [Acidimicrobiales bacterium]
MAERTAHSNTEVGPIDYDVVVVGAGFAGMYLLHRLRNAGFSAKVFERGTSIGGTWYWNRYPGARCDVRSIDYSYSFDPVLEQEWEWSEKFATQPEILRYANHVADRYELRDGIQCNTTVRGATYDEEAKTWRVTVDPEGSNVEELVARHVVLATGCLSQSKQPEIDGIEDFGGDLYHTGHWPHHAEGDAKILTGKRVAVIGTGSSGIQSIPIIAEEAAHLTVFQRTPNFSIPSRNGLPDPEELASIKADYPAYRQLAKESAGGAPRPLPTKGALEVSADEREAAYRAGWEEGGLGGILASFTDLRLDEESNETAAEFIREQIRSIVDDPATAAMLCPTDHPFGTKRPCLDTNYYATYNRPDVDLVDLRATPLQRVTANGLETTERSYEFDAIVFATGFDAMTGAIAAIDIAGVAGLELRKKWEDGPRTYLGLMVAGFPNLFTVTGPGSPSVLSNMMVSIEQHVDWIADCLENLRATGADSIEATVEAEDDWVDHVREVGDATLYPKANSWYMGANVPGKPRVFLPYVGGVGAYRAICDEIVADGYRGFTLD